MVSGDTPTKVMECHSGNPKRPKVCVGFAAIVGYKSLGFRFSVLFGLIDNYNPDKTPFHPSVDALLAFHPECSADLDGDEEESTNG